MKRWKTLRLAGALDRKHLELPNGHAKLLNSNSELGLSRQFGSSDLEPTLIELQRVEELGR